MRPRSVIVPPAQWTYEPSFGKFVQVRSQMFRAAVVNARNVSEDAAFVFAKAQARGTRATRRVLNAKHKVRP